MQYWNQREKRSRNRLHDAYNAERQPEKLPVTEVSFELLLIAKVCEDVLIIKELLVGFGSWVSVRVFRVHCRLRGKMSAGWKRTRGDERNVPSRRLISKVVYVQCHHRILASDPLTEQKVIMMVAFI